MQRRVQAHERVAPVPVDLEAHGFADLGQRRAGGDDCAMEPGPAPLRVSVIAMRSPLSRIRKPVSPGWPPPSG